MLLRDSLLQGRIPLLARNMELMNVATSQIAGDIAHSAARP
jgi:hypothetical protein